MQWTKARTTREEEEEEEEEEANTKTGRGTTAEAEVGMVSGVATEPKTTLAADTQTAVAAAGHCHR